MGYTMVCLFMGLNLQLFTTEVPLWWGSLFLNTQLIISSAYAVLLIASLWFFHFFRNIFKGSFIFQIFFWRIFSFHHHVLLYVSCINPCTLKHCSNIQNFPFHGHSNPTPYSHYLAASHSPVNLSSHGADLDSILALVTPLRDRSFMS